MARTANRALAAQWRERLARWRRSKLSIAAFCRQEQVSQPSFFQWRRRLKAAAAPRPQTGFVELPAPAWPAAGVQVTLPGGAVVSIPAQASPEVITAVLRAALHPAGENERC
jgi:hypothetical protein